jgi:ERCC4-type nuclease
MKILIDTREQNPFTFQGYDVTPETATLTVGDYSLPPLQYQAAIERKSLDDLVGCLIGSNRERFERELARGRHYDLFAVVVEASLADVSQARYRSAMKPQAALQSIVTFQVRYRVPFMWCGNRAGGQRRQAPGPGPHKEGAGGIPYLVASIPSSPGPGRGGHD